MRCPFCHQPIDRNNAWKGTADILYVAYNIIDRSCFLGAGLELILLWGLVGAGPLHF